MRSNLKKFVAGCLSSLHPQNSKDKFVLTYHAVNNLKNDLTSDIYQLDKIKFISQINYLKNNNIRFTTLDNLFDDSTGCLVTFDDGYKDILHNAVKFLIENDIPCLIFVCPEYLKSSSNYYINIDELKELARNPLITIGSHSFNHVPLKDCNDDKLEFELRDSKKFIEEIISKKVKAISYPFGSFDYRTVKFAKKAGYDYGFTTKFNFLNQGEDKFTIPRVDIWNNDNYSSFKNKISGKWNWMRFFSKY